MSGAQYKKNGLLIPAEWLKKMGDDINVQRAGAVVKPGSLANASPPISVAKARHWTSVVQLMTHQASCPTQG